MALTLTGDEQTVVVQNGVTKQASVLQIANVVIPGKFITNIEYDNATYMIIIYYSDGTTQEIGPIPGYKNAYINDDGDIVHSSYAGNKYPVSYFTYEEQANEAKRQIKVLKARYVPQYVKNFQEIVNV